MTERASSSVPSDEVEGEPYAPPPVSLPEMIDPGASERLMRRYYPRALLESGVGGTVYLLLWVDTTGTVDHVQVSRGSGSPELDKAAVDAAPHLHFRPATRNGTAVGTWVEFPLTFEVIPSAAPAPSQGAVAPGGGGLRRRLVRPAAAPPRRRPESRPGRFAASHLGPFALPV